MYDGLCEVPQPPKGSRALLIMTIDASGAQYMEGTRQSVLGGLVNGTMCVQVHVWWGANWLNV